MGRINLAALRVRKRALAKKQANSPSSLPIWTDILATIPPAQILTRNQPTHHPAPSIRTKPLPGGRISLYKTAAPKDNKPRPTLTHKAALYKPVQLEYTEDALRHQFYTDHPWELARPRVVLETNGPSPTPISDAYSTGPRQPGVPLSGESVIQRQLYLLQHQPSLSLEETYDIARKEFYALRRRETTRRRIAIEEAVMMGASFPPSDIAKSVRIENKNYDDWATWAEAELMAYDARSAAFAGQQVQGEKKAIDERAGGGASGGGSANGAGGSSMIAPVRSRGGMQMPARPAPVRSDRVGAAVGSVAGAGASGIGADVFAREARRQSAIGR